MLTGKPVVFDDCRESDGTMIEAKGPGYAERLANTFMAKSLADEWAEQATRQLQASGDRGLEWYFAEEDAAAWARQVFEDNDDYRNLRGKITLFTVPAETP